MSSLVPVILLLCNKNGPSHWHKTFPACGGNNQSPIEIDDKISTAPESLWRPLKFLGYDNFPKKMQIKINYGSVQVRGNWHAQPTVRGGPLNNDYLFHHLHFHWGPNDREGSEHTLHGKRYPVELHLVHFRGNYCRLSKALSHPDGLAVVAVFMEISEDDNVKLQKFFREVVEVSGHNSSISISPFPLNLLLPKKIRRFYSYHGSLTIPHCNEAVTWIILNDTTEISPDQVEVFRELKYSDGQHILHNYRPLQNRNERKVHSY
ncbi:carbonic anhydrase 2-like isoform X2 [Macrobrachium nipponense]|uniref:carbonic anhydrase 2-like isoform X2 n=1 Tax=Macrobrachium nipponense TaxID=159736 RepID=UPI0030C7BC0C